MAAFAFAIAFGLAWGAVGSLLLIFGVLKLVLRVPGRIFGHVAMPNVPAGPPRGRPGWVVELACGKAGARHPRGHRARRAVHRTTPRWRHAVGRMSSTRRGSGPTGCDPIQTARRSRSAWWSASIPIRRRRSISVVVVTRTPSTSMGSALLARSTRNRRASSAGHDLLAEAVAVSTRQGHVACPLRTQGLAMFLRRGSR